MECSEIRAILLENTDAEVPSEFREGVDAHVAACRACAMWLEALREQANALGSLPRVPAPRDFLQRVKSRVERPSVWSRLTQEVSGFFAGKRFYQLAGAAATAVVVIVAARVVLHDGGQRALPPPASSSIESSKPAGPAPSAAVPYAANPHTAATQAATPPAAEQHRLAGAETQSVVLTVKPSAASLKSKSGGAFKPESIAGAKPNAAKMSAQSEKSLRQEVSRATGGAAKAAGRAAKVPETTKVPEAARVPESGPASNTPSTEQISTDVIRLIEQANGKVLSAAPAPDDNRHEAVLAEMPAANYPSFLEQLRRLGDVESNGDKEFSLAPDSSVRVSVSVDTRE